MNKYTNVDYLRKFIVTKVDSVAVVLQAFKTLQKERLTFPELRRELGISSNSGTFSQTIRDIKTLGLLKNGGQILEITELGWRFLDDRNPVFLQNLALKLPYFRDMYSRGIDSRAEAQKYLQEMLLGAKYSRSTYEMRTSLGAIRYMEYVFNERQHIKKAHRSTPSRKAESTPKQTASKWSSLITEIESLNEKYSSKEITAALEFIQNVKK